MYKFSRCNSAENPLNKIPIKAYNFAEMKMEGFKTSKTLNVEINISADLDESLLSVLSIQFVSNLVQKNPSCDLECG